MVKSLRQSFINNNNAGFTLIELMIVVAIIGILASIALPAYQTYVAKAKITSLVASAASGKTALFERYTQDGMMPVPSQRPGGMGDPATVSRDFWLVMKSIANTGVTVTKLSDTEVRINMVLREVNGNVNGKTLRFHYKDDGNALVFECVPAVTIDDKYLPKVCKS